MPTTTTPKRVSTQIQALAHKIVPESELVRIPVRPRSDAVPDDCFGNVARQVNEFAGEIVHGWCIWEWPCTMLEAEFHAVWQSPDGSLVDVTNKPQGEREILFVIDPLKKFEGSQVNNVRSPLRNDPLVTEWIKLHDRRFDVMNAGIRGSQYGAISVPTSEIEPVIRRLMEIGPKLERLMPGRNDPCCCGSGKKFKRCCGSAV